jgi:hypothetical protein
MHSHLKSSPNPFRSPHLSHSESSRERSEKLFPNPLKCPNTSAYPLKQKKKKKKSKTCKEESVVRYPSSRVNLQTSLIILPTYHHCPFFIILPYLSLLLLAHVTLEYQGLGHSRRLKFLLSCLLLRTLANLQ